MTSLLGSLNTGKGPALPKAVTDSLASRRAKAAYVASNTLQATPWVEGATDQVTPEGSIQAARTPDGQVALMTFRITSTRTAKPNATMKFTDPAHAKAVGQEGSYRVLTFRNALTLAVEIDAKGKPTVLGHTFYNLT